MEAEAVEEGEVPVTALENVGSPGTQPPHTPLATRTCACTLALKPHRKPRT